jgi:diguanylate cyclase (GGDEF)-like protein
MLDTRSLVSALALILTIGIVLHFVNWRIHRNSEGAKFWCIGLSVQTVGLFLSASFNVEADTHPVFLFVMNMLVSTGHVLMLYGTACFAERPFRPRLYILLFALMAAGYGWYCLVDPHVIGRVLTLAGILVVTNALSLTRLWHIGRRDGPAGAVVLASAMAATIAVASTLMVLQVMAGPEVQNVYDNSNALLPVAVLTLIAFETTTIFGYLLLSAGYSQARLRKMALTDPMTGLANRRAFDREIVRRLATGHAPERTLALILFDIDRFKQVNDTYGHDVGDRVIQHIATTARAVSRPRDAVARIGGEEFAIIVDERDSAALESLAGRLRSAVEAAPARVEGQHVAVTISAGCARAVCRDAADVENLFRQADAALYAAKTHGRNRVEIAPERSD